MTRLFALAFVALTAAVQAQSATYLDHGALSRELRRVVGSSPSAKLTSLGTTLGGREIWVVEIGNPGGKPLAQRPGVLVVGNLEGDQLVGSSHALETVRYLLANAASPTVKAVLDANVVYLLPRLNPDGAEVAFASVKADRRGNARPYDDDNDGRVDEDGPEDLNGDGLISVMRVKDPAGAYMIDPADPRTLKKADVAKGETGTYKLYWEGVDSDGDGFINEDGPGGVDLNRNFQHDYPYFDADAGPHMVSERESRALMDFVLTHRNIAAILTFGQSDNLVTPPDAAGKLAAATPLNLPAFADASNASVFESGMLQQAFRGGGFGGFGFGGGAGGGGTRLRGAQPGANNNPASGRRPDTTVHRADIEYFKAVSEAYKALTGIKALPPLRRPRGAFFQFGYYQFGVPSFSTPGWALPAAAAETKPAGAAEAKPAATGDAAVLRALEGAGVNAFVPWTAYKHAQLGDVEIGGFRPSVTSSAPAKDLAELGRKHGEFVVKLASMLPRVRIASTEVKAHGGGLFTVTVDVENTGFFPSSLQHGVVSGSVKPVLVQIQVPVESIVTGAPKAMRIASLNGSNSRQRISWVIRGKSGAAVVIDLLAQKGGTDSATVTLK